MDMPKRGRSIIMSHDQSSLTGNIAMRAIEFETVVKHNMLRIPGNIPDGTRLRVRVLVEEPGSETDGRVSDALPRQKPSPRLTGTVRMQDDLLEPAVSPEEWDALK